MELTEKINKQLMTAMKAKNEARKRTLRAIKAQFTLLSTTGDEVTEAMQVKVIQKMVKERHDSLAIYIAQSRHDLAEPEAEEIEILEEFLPEQMSEEDLRDEIAIVIFDHNVISMKDMGRIMKEIRIKFPNVDGKLASTIVKEFLGILEKRNI